MKYLQYKDSGEYTAWQLAQAVAAAMKEMGLAATAKQGPVATSPDDEPTVHCAHVVTTTEAYAEYRYRRAAAKAAR